MAWSCPQPTPQYVTSKAPSPFFGQNITQDTVGTGLTVNIEGQVLVSFVIITLASSIDPSWAQSSCLMHLYGLKANNNCHAFIDHLLHPSIWFSMIVSFNPHSDPERQLSFALP